MSNAQRVIKYCAIAFAVFLIFSIISALTLGIGIVANIYDDDSVIENLNMLDINKNSSILEIDISASQLVIKDGSSLKAETNNKYIECKQEDNKLTIKEKKHNWFRKNNNSELIIYIPEDFIFDVIAIDTGAGKVDSEKLITKKLYLDLGAGKVDIGNLVVSDKAYIDGGAGEIIIKNGAINDLDLSIGVGRFSLTSILTGDSKIDSGVGEVDLNLIGDNNDYKIKLDKGIGSANLNGNNMNDNTYYGNGSNIIDIDGGVGSIKINYVSK